MKAMNSKERSCFTSVVCRTSSVTILLRSQPFSLLGGEPDGSGMLPCGGFDDGDGDVLWYHTFILIFLNYFFFLFPVLIPFFFPLFFPFKFVSNIPRG